MSPLTDNLYAKASLEHLLCYFHVMSQGPPWIRVLVTITIWVFIDNSKLLRHHERWLIQTTQVCQWLKTHFHNLCTWLTPWRRRVEALPKPSRCWPLNLALTRPWWPRIRTGTEARRTSPSFSATTTPSTSAIPSVRALSHGPRTHYLIGECRPIPHIRMAYGFKFRVTKILVSDDGLFLGWKLSLVSYFL